MYPIHTTIFHKHKQARIHTNEVALPLDIIHGTCSRRLASQTNILTKFTTSTDTSDVQRLSQSAHTRNNFKLNSLQPDSHARAFFSQLISISQTENYTELRSFFFLLGKVRRRNTTNGLLIFEMKNAWHHDELLSILSKPFTFGEYVRINHN